MSTSRKRSGFASYPPIFIGLVTVLAGVAAAGCFLAAAGEGAVTGSLFFGSLTALLLLVGFGLLIAGSQARGGMLSAEPTAVERRRYRALYRSSRGSSAR